MTSQLPMYKITLAFFVFIFITPITTQAKTLNSLFIDDDTFSVRAVASYGDQLIYTKTSKTNDELWLYRPDVSESMFLTSLQKAALIFRRDYRFIVNNDRLFYITSLVNGQSGIWVSDFTPSGTVELTAIPNLRIDRGMPLVINNGYVMTAGRNENSQSNLIHVSHSGLRSYPLSIYSLIHTCVFNPDNIITIERSDDGFSLKHIIGDQVLDLQTLNIDTNFPKVNSMFVHNNGCLIAYQSIEGIELLNITKDGEINDLNGSTAIAELSATELFVFKQRIYALGRGLESDNSAGIFQLSESLQSIDAMNSQPGGSTPNFSFFEPKVGKNFITLRRSITDPSGTQLSYFDENLKELSRPFTDLSAQHLPPPIIHEFSDRELFLFDIGSSRDITDLYFIDGMTSQDSSSIIQFKLSIREAFSNAKSTIGYANVFDKIERKHKVYSIEDTPHISRQISGAWLDITRNNQGMMINKGTRTNGSEYLFVSIYTFDNGQPLWLAGTGEITSASPIINMDLFQFDGIGEFEQGAMPNQQVYGTLDLQVTGCDRMTAEISNTNTLFTLDLTRVNDTSFVNLCFD